MSRQLEGMLLSNIELFCSVAQHEGFTAAARESGMTTAAISRAVSRLEERLGIRLLSRTTRRVRLTDAGQRYFEQCRQAIAQLAEAGREVTGQQTQPAGIVRMSLPTGYGHLRVLPLLPAFNLRYPQIELHLQLSNHNVNFVEDGFDLAVRGRNPPDSSLIARKLEDAQLVVIASPEYLHRSGVPQVLNDLVEHECIQFVLPRTGVPVPWVFKLNDHFVDVQTQGKFCCSEDIQAPVTLARAGAGLAQTYRYLVEEDLREGRLVELLAERGGASRPFSLIYPSNRHVPLRVRLFIDYLVEILSSGSPTQRHKSQHDAA